jgi:catechol 2,3-dioxygenase
MGLFDKFQGLAGARGELDKIGIDPFGVVIEYTAEIQQIDDTYRVGRPEDWKWPEGRVDHWGISGPPSPRLKQAQKAIFFAPVG